jgi:hypothetical protein
MTWKLPRWIDARLPHINIEGTAARDLLERDGVDLDEASEREGTPVGS